MLIRHSVLVIVTHASTNLAYWLELLVAATQQIICCQYNMFLWVKKMYLNRIEYAYG